MKIKVSYTPSAASYVPMLTNGGAHREKDGTLRLYYYPYFEERL